MEDLNFSILDILLFTGLFLLFVRVRGNGIIKELVFLSILLVYAYVTLNNLETVYGYFDEQGLSYADEIYNGFLILFATAGLPFVNFFSGLYIPKIKGIASMILGCALAIVRFLLLIFFILSLSGIIIIQFYWISSSLQNKEQEFSMAVGQIINSVAKEIETHCGQVKYDLIICGRESIDYNGGIVPGLIAGFLDYNFC